MKRRIAALLLALLTVLGVFPVTALAAANIPDALGEVDIYHSGEKMDYLSINGQARSQTYTYYNYKAPDGSTKQIPAYCVNPNTAGVPQKVPAGSSIQYLADDKATDPKVTGTVASGYPHRTLDALGLNSPQEAYYATKMALWCYLISGWNIQDLQVNPSCSDQAAAQRVLTAAKKIYSDGMCWTVDKNPRITPHPRPDRTLPRHRQRYRLPPASLHLGERDVGGRRAGRRGLRRPRRGPGWHPDHRHERQGYHQDSGLYPHWDQLQRAV